MKQSKIILLAVFILIMMTPITSVSGETQEYSELEKLEENEKVEVKTDTSKEDIMIEFFDDSSPAPFDNEDNLEGEGNIPEEIEEEIESGPDDSYIIEDDYDFPEWDDFDGFTDFEGSTDSSYDYYEPEREEEEEKEESNPEDKFINPKQTFHYSLSDKDDKQKKFIDTGIAYKEGVAPKAEDLKEILRQISIKTNAKLISDENRFMVLANEEFAIIDGNYEDVSTLISAFEKIGVTLKIQSSKSGQKFTLADYLEVKEDLTIEIDDEEIELIAEPEVSDSRVLLPIRSIGEELGAEVTWDDETAIATIETEDVLIEIKANENIILVNGEEYIIGKETKMKEDEDRIVSLVNLIVTKLGAEMRWDSTSRVLSIKTIEVELDDYY